MRNLLIRLLILPLFAGVRFLNAESIPFSWFDSRDVVYAQAIEPHNYNGQAAFLQYAQCRYERMCSWIKYATLSGSERYFLIDNQILLTIERASFKDVLTKIENNAQLLCENCDIEFSPTRTKLTLILRPLSEDVQETIELLSAFNTNRIDGVIAAEPNRLNFFERNSILNDFYLPRSWFILNQQQQIFCQQDRQVSESVQLGIDKVWISGITGNGVKIGVIDFDGFEFSHPDMHGQFLEGWNGITNTVYDASSFYPTNLAHGMAVSGIIAAKADNHEGSAGIAHGSKIVPLKIDGSEVSLIRVLQKAGPENLNVDILNMSFSQYGFSQAVANEIDFLSEYGRQIGNQHYGTLVIASYGNDFLHDSVQQPFPGGLSQVLSVGASTPDDFLKIKGDIWNNGNTWGSNYGEHLDVIAPGVCIFTTDFSGQAGYVSGQDYFGFQMTSAAAPIVSGIAALVLESEPYLTAQALKNRIIQTADQVHPHTYQYQNGKNVYVGYGRVNAFKAVHHSTSAVSDMHQKDGFLQKITMNSQHIRLNFTEGEVMEGKQFRLHVYDFSGRLIFEYFSKIKSEVFINHQLPLATGLYLVSVSGVNSHFNLTEKQLFISN